jgi:hypothetical protein
MSFTRVNPGGWSVNAQLGSSQMNSLDIDHANALDKSTAGDQLAGVVTMAATAAVRVNTAGAFIRSEIAGGITSNIAAGIQSGIAGGIQLTGGASDWETFSATRSRTLTVPAQDVAGMSTAALTAGNTAGSFTPYASSGPLLNPNNGGFQTQVVSASASAWTYYLPIRQLHNGATLASATLYMQGASGHSNLPAVMPAFGLFRFSSLTSGSWNMMGSPFYVSDTTAVVATYKTVHSWTFTCTAANVIETTQYYYAVLIWDECSTNSAPANVYYGLTLSYTGIANMAFP